MNGYVVLVASLVLYLFDVAVDCLVFVVNCMLVCQKRLIFILILILILILNISHTEPNSRKWPKPVFMNND